MNVCFYFHFLLGVEHVICCVNEFYLHRPYYFHGFKCGSSTYENILSRPDYMSKFLSTSSILK